MLGKFIKINNETLPNPETGTYVERLNPDENVYKSEAGTQLVNTLRLDRLSWAATFPCTLAMRNKILAWCKTPQVTSQINGGEVLSGRLRLSGDVVLVAHSEYMSDTNGLYQVPVVFEQF